MTGVDKEELKSRIKNLKSKVDSNAHFENIEISLLKQRNISNSNSETGIESAMDHCCIKGNASLRMHLWIPAWKHLLLCLMMFVTSDNNMIIAVQITYTI